MELIDQIFSSVNQKFKELQDYTNVYNEKAKNDREVIIEQAKEQFKKDPNSVDIEEIGRDVLFVNGFHQTDIRRLQNSLLEVYKIYRELGGDKEFSKELEETVNYLKLNLPKQIFVTKAGVFEEIEEGKLEKLTTDYKEKNYYRLFEAQVKQLLNE